MGNSSVSILVLIMVVVLIGYLSAVAYQHYILKKMRGVQEQFAQVQALPVQAELDDAAKMNFSGETLDRLNEFQNAYQDLIDNLFPEIDENVKQLEQNSKTLNVIKANQLSNTLTNAVTGALDQAQSIQAGLAQLKDLDRHHEQVIEDLTERFKQMHSTLLAKNYTFGPATDKLEARLNKVEEHFETFKQLSASGDHEAAEAKLPELTGQTDQLKAFFEDIPPLFKSLNSEYPEQVSEIRRGHREMVAQGFKFADDNIDGAIDFVNQQINANLDNLADLEIAKTKASNHQLDKMIDQFYDVMEAEIKAKQRVEKQTDVISAFINHAQHQNIELMTELKQLAQNYDLEHREVETTRELGEQIKNIAQTHQTDMQLVADHQAVFSTVSDHISDAKKALSQIEAQQREINESVSGLNEEEDCAVSAVQDFELRMHTMRRKIENLNLPGISDDYMDAYSLVSGEIEKIATAMNQTKIKMEDINQQIAVIKSDVDNLAERTDTLVDSAILSEEMMQYANRYRNSHADIAEASSRAHYLFDREYQYEESLNVIVTALNRIDPAIYHRIQDAYFKQSNH